MINPSELLSILRSEGVGFFTGVPDSLLKPFCGCLAESAGDKVHITAANEGGAVALAAGYHLAASKIPLVYMQNSRIGNAVNPLLSLTDREVYSIPMLLMIGWRGKPGVKDEPQHITQGRVQNTLLETMGIPFKVLGPGTENLRETVTEALETAKRRSSPYALVIEPGSFENFTPGKSPECISPLSREEAIETVLDIIPEKSVVVSTTGKTSREVYECRERKPCGHSNDFLTVGSMGHASQIALGIALNTARQVLCLDGDGAALMHMGSMAIIGTQAPENLIHIILNNGCHDSVGGQPTVCRDINFPDIAAACGYRNTMRAVSREKLDEALREALKSKGPSMIEVYVSRGARADLGRPGTSPAENKKELMRLLNEDNDG